VYNPCSYDHDYHYHDEGTYDVLFECVVSEIFKLSVFLE